MTKNRWMSLAGALALLAVVGRFYALPAIAQTVRAAIVKNIDERGRNPYVANVTCTPVSRQCIAQGTTIPAGMRLVVENINLVGLFPSPTTVTVRSAMFVNTAPQRAHDVTGGTYNLSGTGRFYALNSNLVDYVEAGETPSLFFVINDSSTDSTFFGTITGYLVNLSN
jgi:hypothetical protein